MKRDSGFTLLELLTIIAIIGILVMMVLTIGRSPMLKSKMTSAVNNFIADFNLARSTAAAENRYVSIVFSADGRTYTVQKQVDITDLSSWKSMKTVAAADYNEKCFKSTEVQSFAVNSMGEVRTYPVAAGMQPTQVRLVFYVSYWKGGVDTVAYRTRITIFPYGGIKVEKMEVST